MSNGYPVGYEVQPGQKVKTILVPEAAEIVSPEGEAISLKKGKYLLFKTGHKSPNGSTVWRLSGTQVPAFTLYTLKTAIDEGRVNPRIVMQKKHSNLTNNWRWGCDACRKARL